MTTAPAGLIPRKASELARRRLAAARGIVVNGPRQAGKTSLLGVLRSEVGGTYISLDRAADLRLARTDPTGFVTGFDPPVFIDEVQRGGDPLVLALKVQLDSSDTRGQYVLAGSTRFLVEPRISESLAGRVRFVDLWPLAQGEIDATADGFVDAALAGAECLMATAYPDLSRTEVFTRVCRGGFPEAVLAASAEDRRDFFADYIRTVTTKDVRDLGALSQRADLRRLSQLLAARTACELNLASFGRDAGVPAQSLRRYLSMLETIYLHHIVPAWSGNLTAKVVNRPKLHMVDSGLAAHLLGVNPSGLARPGSPQAGALLETFVAGELARQLTWSKADARLYHWRDRGGREVDLVIEAADGTVVGVEVKAAVDVGREDFAGLRTLAARLGDRFSAGVVIHCGERGTRFEPKLIALPVSALWTAS